MKKKKKVEELMNALKVITTHCPCYGERNDDPAYIVIGNGLQLRNSKDKFITSGLASVAEELIKRYS